MSGGWIRVTLVVSPLSRALSAARRLPWAVLLAWRGECCDCCGCYACRCPLPEEENYMYPWTCRCSRLGGAVWRAAARAGRAWRRRSGGASRPAVADPRLALWTAWL